MENAFGPGPLLPQLNRSGLELDQRLQTAIEIAHAHHPNESLIDSWVFHALLQLHTFGSWQHEIEESIERQGNNYRRWLWLSTKPSNFSLRNSLAEVRLNVSLAHTLSRAVMIRSEPNTIGAKDFIKAIAQLSAEFPEPFSKISGLNHGRPHTLDMLCELLDGERHLDLADAKITAEVLSKFSTLGGPDDFQFLIGFQGDRLVLRSYSVLADFTIRSDTGLLIPKRGILTHLLDRLGAFAESEIHELEELLNSQNSVERDYQLFFERHPHFFRRWDYREVHPHVILQREQGNLVPDFLLTDRDTQRAAIVELKLPKTIVRRQLNRDRFSASVMEARTQLLRYRDWFDEKANRQKFLDIIGMEIFRPNLVVLMGRSADFTDSVDRQRLAADASDIEVVTYDDMLLYAKRRCLLVERISEGAKIE
jgi:hypothetical protein